MWPVAIVPEAEAELLRIPPAEQEAIRAAIEKLKADGDRLGAPHSSAVQGVRATLRELRPRRGRSPFRALYRRIGPTFVVAAVGPEAQVDRRGFDRAVAVAVERLEAYEP